MKFLSLAIFTMSLFTLCTHTQPLVARSESLPAKTLLDIAYGPDSMQRMDIYLPAGRSSDSTPVLFLLHGGGWAGGEKWEFAKVIPLLQQRLPHYAFVNMNYRLASQTNNHFPTQEKDVSTGLQNLVDNAAAYQVSKNVVLLGASAGAHLALLQAYKQVTPVVPKAVISFFGPSDLTDLYNGQRNSYYQFGLQLLIGGTPADNPALYAQASPLTYAGQRQVPTLLLHGSNDPLVPVTQSKKLKEKLDSAHVPNELVIYPAEGHGWSGANLTNSYERIQKFLETHVDLSMHR